MTTKMTANELGNKLEKIFNSWEISNEISGFVARNMADAHRYGHPTHGVQLLPRYQFMINNNIIGKNPLLDITIDQNSVTADAKNSFGHWALPQVIKKAAEIGSPIASFSIKNLGHTGYLAGCLRESNLDNHVVMLWVNSSGGRLVKPYGGTGKLMSTSVMAVATPGGYVLDLSTPTISENAVRRHLIANTQLEVDLLLEDGTTSRNPKDLYIQTPTGPNALLSKTAIGFNDHKLFNLGIVAEILAGLVTDSGTSKDDKRHSGCFGFVVRTDESLGNKISDYLTWLRNGSNLRLPGDKMYEDVTLLPWEEKILNSFAVDKEQ